jgi:hypothetical protein
MGSFEIVSLEDSQTWNKSLQKLDSHLYDIYFTPEYYKIYTELGNGNAQCFIFQKDDSIALYPFLLNSVNELSYHFDHEYFDIEGAYGYNGIVSNDNSFDFRNSFYIAFNDYCKEKNIIAEFTRFHPIIDNYKFSEDFISITKNRNTISIDLTQGYDFIWDKHYSSRNRNMIRKARKNQFSIGLYENPSNNTIESFFALYHKTMKSIDAEDYYYFNDSYFKNIFKYLKSKSLLLEVVNNRNQVECAAIVIFQGLFSHYHLSARISNSDNSVNNYILDEAIKHSISAGAKHFHLGGGATSNNDDTLLKFKSNFSKEKREFFVGKKIHNIVIYNKVIEQWARKYPDKSNKYKDILLRYRY